MPRRRSSSGRVAASRIDHVNARIIGELPFEIARKSRIQFEEEQLANPAHPAGNLAGVDSFARTVLGDDARSAEIHFARTRSTSALELGMMEAI